MALLAAWSACTSDGRHSEDEATVELVTSALTLTSGAAQVNCGASTIAPFIADTDFSGGDMRTRTNTIDLSKVTNPAPMAVYQSQRFGNFTYTFGGFVAGSSHSVRLHFADTHWTTPGNRTFSVTVNGAVVLNNFDLVATAGAGNRAYIYSFTAAADSTGKYVLVFKATKDAATVSAIEILNTVSYSVPKTDVTAHACADGTQPVGCRAFDCATGTDAGQWASAPTCGPTYPACKNVCPTQGTALSSGAPERKGSIVQCTCSCADPVSSTASSFTIGITGCVDPAAASPCTGICASAKPCGGADASCAIGACSGGQSSGVVAAQTCDPTASGIVGTSSVSDWQATVDSTQSEMVVSVGASQTHVPLSGTLGLNGSAAGLELTSGSFSAAAFSFFGRQVTSPKMLLVHTSAPTAAQSTDEFGSLSGSFPPGAITVSVSGVVDGQAQTMLVSNPAVVSTTFQPTYGTVGLSLHSAPSLGTSVDVHMTAKLIRRPPSASMTGTTSVAECSANRAALVHLDGSKSTSSSGSIVKYQWFARRTDAGVIDPVVRGLTSASVADVSLGIGFYQVALNVYDNGGATGGTTSNVVVKDSKPPTIQSPGDVSKFGISGTVQVNLGWPVTSDQCDPRPTVHATLVKSNGSTVNQLISDPAHLSLAPGQYTVRWTTADGSGNASSVDQIVSLSSDDVGVIKSALGVAPPACPQPALTGTTPAHVNVHVCVFGTHDVSTVPPQRVGSTAWASCPDGNDACVTNNLQTMLNGVNQIWNGTVQFDLAGFKVIADSAPPVPGHPRPFCSMTFEQYGDICIDTGFGNSAGDEVNAELVSCENAWGFTDVSHGADGCNRGLVLLVARKSLNLTQGVGTAGPPINSFTPSCTDLSKAVNNQGAFAVVDGDLAASNALLPAHELGHALGLGHGDGLDNDCNGVFDDDCDPPEFSFNEDGLSLMSALGQVNVITNLQKNRARAHAVAAPPGSGPAGASCPAVTPPPAPANIGTPPAPPTKVGCSCVVGDGDRTTGLWAIGLVAMVALGARRRGRRRPVCRTRH